jgi:tetratricopeptide (TPR) repeat protein
MGCHALACFDQLQSDHGRAHTASHLGSLYTRQHRWDLARRHFERACDLWRTMGDDHGLMRGFINLGGLYCDMTAPDEALPFLHQARSLAARSGEVAELGKIYHNLAIAYRLSGELGQAETAIRQAETFFRRFSNLTGLALAHDELGLIFLAQRQWAAALSHLKEAYERWHSLDSPREKIRNRGYRIELELARGDLKEAARHLRDVERLIRQHALRPNDPYWRASLARARAILAQSGLS